MALQEGMTNDQHNQIYTECASCLHIADRTLTAQLSKRMHLDLLLRVRQDQRKTCRLMAHTVQVVWPAGRLTLGRE